MLRIHSFLRGIYSFIKKSISKKVYRTCAIITTGMMIIAIITLTSNGFGGGGKNKTSMDIIDEASSEQEEEEEIEADNIAKVQTEIADLNHIETQFDWQYESDSKKEKLLSAKEKNRIASVTQSSTAEEPTDVDVIEAVKNIGEEEYDILLHIVAAEAGGCDIKGQILVANVIFNRMENEKFPNTIKEVVFQKNQFTPALNGTIWNAHISDLTKEAVDRALNGEDFSEGALFFSARSMVDPDDMTWFDRNLKWLFEHDGHEFFAFK
ncbi:MAG: cell wall hydrolase [Clostridiales bacterium]|nr:cell wall hydrolase [Clostridiales bacterium]